MTYLVSQERGENVDSTWLQFMDSDKKDEDNNFVQQLNLYSPKIINFIVLCSF